MRGSNNKFMAILVVRVSKWAGGHPDKSKKNIGFIHWQALVVTDEVYVGQALGCS